MDYERIYKSFIEARRSTPVPVQDWDQAEFHHIIPIYRCSYERGSKKDRADTSNKVRLRWSDHLFAHLLLAKFDPNPKAWATLRFMLGVFTNRHDMNLIAGGRERYDRWRRIALAQLDSTVFDFVHEDGETFSGTPYQMRDLTGIDLRRFRQLTHRGNKSCAGWRLASTAIEETGSPTGPRHQNYDTTIYCFVHVDDRRFEGTQNTFAKTYAIRQADVSGVVCGSHLSAAGWRLANTPIEATDHRKGEKNINYDANVYTFMNSEGLTEVCTQLQLQKRHCVHSSYTSRLVSGMLMIAGGWRLGTTPEDYSGRKRGFDHHRVSTTILHFRHVDGREEHCTSYELGKKFGLPPVGVSQFVTGKAKSCNGWHLASTAVTSVGNPKGTARHDYDPTIYTFIHEDGSTYNRTRLAFVAKTGLLDRSVRRLIKSDALSVKGWRMHTTPASHAGSAKGSRHFRFDSKLYSFVHVDGREELLTQSAMSEKTGIPKASINAVTTGRFKSAMGWRLASTLAEDAGQGRKGNAHYNYDALTYQFVHNDGRTEDLTQHDMRKKHSISAAGISMLVNGKNPTCKGWRIRKAPAQLSLAFRD